MGETTNEVGHGGERRNQSDDRSSVRTTQSTADLAEEGRNTAQIRSDIEQTRADLSDTIGVLQEKLDPSRIAEQVKDQLREKATEAYDTAKTAVRDATVGKAEKIMANVSETVTDMTGRAGAAVTDTGSTVVRYIRENPVPFALVGIGLGMLAFNKRQNQQASHETRRTPESDRYVRSGTSESIASGITEKARGAAETVAETARAATERAKGAFSAAATTVSDAASSAAGTTRQQFTTLSDQARQGTRAATDRFRTTLQENPMALGVAALAAGAIVGLTLPTTRVEGEYMGETRDRLVDQAKSLAHETAGKVQRATEEAGRSLKEAAQKEGLMTEQSA
jgi:ElaB/YqjD/DUF883 family membrane-anchored ribosome-binding protein